MSPKFGFFKRKTSDYFHNKQSQDNFVNSVTDKELSEIIDNEKKTLESDLSTSLEPIRNSVLECLNRLKKDADELEVQEIKIEDPRFEPLINNSKKILITSIKKESFIESSEIKSYKDAVKFKNNLELLINRFGQVGDSHNRILNEFMRKQINKLKNEFDNLSSLLKEITKTLSSRESEISKCIECKNDLVLFREKLSEKKVKQDRLLELMKEGETINKNIETTKREYDGFQKSQEFLNTLKIQEKINDKKKEIGLFEKNMINIVSNLSRPITKFSYMAPKETQGRLSIMLNKPLEIFNDSSQYLQLLSELKKELVEGSIKIKDPEKTIHQIDEIIDSLPSLSSDLKRLKDELIQLELSTNSGNMKHFQDIKDNTEKYEKYRLENISKTEETKNSINEIESASQELKKKIENTVLELTQSNYSLM